MADIRVLSADTVHAAESLALLQGFLADGLFTCDVGERGWFEDLAIYRRGALMLGVMIHEREGYLRLSDEDAAALRALGVPVGGPALAMSF